MLSRHFCLLYWRAAGGLNEALKCNLQIRIKVDAWIQTQRKMLMEFRGSRAVESSASKQHFFQKKSKSSCFQLGVLLTASLPGSMCLLIHQGREGAQLVSQTPGSKQLPCSCCWTRGADVIKNAWEQHLFCSCNTCFIYSCTHAACLVVSMQSPNISLSRGGGIEACDADLLFLFY